MRGRQHVLIGTTATVATGIGIVSSGSSIVNVMPIVIGGVIGSYIPDIDSHKSKAAQMFNKILSISIVVLAILYSLGITLDLEKLSSFFNSDNPKTIAVLMFAVLTILGKLSPHRMFTHKWFGTMLFCYSVYLMGNIYFTIGFVTGYILHIVADTMTKNGKYLKFFQFKLPCRNSKNKFDISW
ncbi:metal-dependent hydrolase [Clostridium bornimense]|uniref:metal-dependent hydrolase n=1 Tax=Clostridium bornimense TaxID=1216932 RepID=UPI001C0F9EE2|nr:metal-dependent hydrolase [Clostridium bornimense]MBU5316222.1 metal-dependent hydrolase [Clostridium bornimense]